MNKYELMVIVDAQIPADQKDQVFKQTLEAVTKGGGKVTNNQVWLDKHKMAFQIKKCREATYSLVKFESAADVIDRIKQTLRLNEKILRFSVIRAGQDNHKKLEAKGD